jgi:hypothetical protein
MFWTGIDLKEHFISENKKVFKAKAMMSSPQDMTQVKVEEFYSDNFLSAPTGYETCN